GRATHGYPVWRESGYPSTPAILYDRPMSESPLSENAFEAIAGSGSLLLLCDHAANALPPGLGTLGLGTLGLAPELLDTHIAHDIGAAAVTRALAAAWGAPALLGRWSRLLVDLNR